MRASVAAVRPFDHPSRDLDDITSSQAQTESRGNRTGGAGGGIRTRTEGFLKPFPLPLGYAGISTISMRTAYGQREVGAGLARGRTTRRATMPSASCPRTVQVIRTSVGCSGAVQSLLALPPGARWTCASPSARPRSSGMRSCSRRPMFRTTSRIRSAAVTSIVGGRNAYSVMATTISRSGAGAHPMSSAQHIRRRIRSKRGHRKVSP
jgi:hypothetical protein